MTEEQIAKLPKHRKDWIGIWGNTWAPVKVRPGTCEACVYNSGSHTPDCQRKRRGMAWSLPLMDLRDAPIAVVGAAEEMRRKGLL